MFHLYQKIQNNDVYVIAEMSANHGGSLEHALEIVRQAAACGADCLKIQTYTADSMTIDCDNKYFHISGGIWNGHRLYDLYREAATPYEWHRVIRNECVRHDIDFLSTPFDAAAVDFLEELGAEAYKIASFELVDLPLIKYAASKGKPMLISTGMGSLQEIQDAVDVCRQAGNGQIVLLKCCSEYPSAWADMRLQNITDMKQRFGVPVGLSDHSAGSLGAIAGVALGACVIEKHVKCGEISSADSQFSMSMDEFGQMVRDVRNTRLAVQGPDYSLTQGERASIVFRRSIFAVKDIKAGEKFTKENIRIIRPGYGMAPEQMDRLSGRYASMDICAGEPLNENMIK